MYVFALCEFNYGYVGQFYQRNDEFGNTEFFSLDGNPLTLEGSYGYYIIDPNPPIPYWAKE